MRGSLIYVILLLYTLQSVSAKRLLSDEQITDQMMKFAKRAMNHNETASFRQILQIISLPAYISRPNALMNFNQPRISLFCVACRAAVETIIRLHKEGVPDDDLAETMIILCAALKVQPMHVCRGLVTLNMPIISYIIDNQPLIKSRSVCGVVLQNNERDSCPYNDARYEWSVDIPEKNSNVKKEYSAKPKAAANFKVAHITDVHYEPKYEVGGLAKCDEVACCRKGQTESESRNWNSLTSEETALESNVHVDSTGTIYIDIDSLNDYDDSELREPKEVSEEKRAGYWGDYRDCDSPWWAFEDSIDHVENQDADMIYFTGDVVDHGIWETTEELITTSVNDTNDKFRTAFKNKPFYPIVGNHEAQPVNQFAPKDITDPELSTAWLYNLLVERWSDWLPSDTTETILTGGYYTVLVKPGFRIIALNTNVCYIYNFWIHWEPSDARSHYKWLIDTLLEAERANEKVHILSHVPTGISDMFHVCAREYSRILRRFSNTIVAEFNGHTHFDEFKIYYEEDGVKPFAVAFNGGSTTPYSFLNPNYRMYDVDGDTYELIDAHTWMYNLSEANETPKKRPRWFKGYSFQEQYGVDSLKPIELDAMLNRMVSEDKDLALEYNINKGRMYESYYMCNQKCVKENLCYIARSELYDSTKCNNLFRTYSSSKMNNRV